jgi:hypothetical protein
MQVNKMSWNYRLVKNEKLLQIHEVYYRNEKPHSITADPVALCGETMEELAKVIDLMKEALSKPILDYEDFNKVG